MLYCGYKFLSLLVPKFSRYEMSDVDCFLNIKSKVNLNDTIMMAVAEVISQSSLSNLPNSFNSSSLKNHQSFNELSSPSFSDRLNVIGIASKRDYETVKSSIESYKKLEQNANFGQVKSLVESFFCKNLADDSVCEFMTKLKVASDSESFRATLFWGMYFIACSVFKKSASDDNVVIHSSDTLDLLLRVNFPSVGKWMRQFKSKYSDSDLFTNPYSENWLKLFYNNLNYSNEISEEEIISSLKSLQKNLVNTFSDSLNKNLPADCFLHPKQSGTETAEKYRKFYHFIGQALVSAVALITVCILIGRYFA